MALTAVCTCILLLLAHTNAETCTKISNCACKLGNGDTIDLSPLDSGKGDSPRFPNIQETGSTLYTYQYNPCTPISCGGIADTAMCQIYTASTPSLYYNCGNQQSVQYDYTGGKLTLKYAEPTGGRYADVHLVCDQSQEGSVGMLTQSQTAPWTYTVTLTTKYACPGAGAAGSGGLSGGDILLIIFFVLLTVYVVGGVVFQVFVRKQTGVDMIPNREFWVGLPGLAKDGACFLKGKATGGGNANYQEVK